jgi:hypothetical protein
MTGRHGPKRAGNAGGILLTDEFGPTHHNLIEGNVVVGNLLDCGITLAGHSSQAVVHGVRAPQKAGVYANVAAHNVVVDNGTVGQGAGILLATGVPGGAVYGNDVRDNVVQGNGLAGITVHSHVSGEDLNDNVIAGNVIGQNNLDGDHDFAPHVDKTTTGVIVATMGPLSIAIAGNQITGDGIGVWYTGPVHISGLASNIFVHVSSQSEEG